MMQAVRGMNDILPDKTPYWEYIEAICAKIATTYGYHQLRTPLVESTALFKHSIGEATDIVEKEMYTFDDRNGESLTLRPEGTASCVRAAIQHGLLHNQIQRLWYLGAMFRYERPQKGRYRQFYQFGVEAFGMTGVEADVEIILLSQRILYELGLENKITLELNTLGDPVSRINYREALVSYFSQHQAHLDEDSKRRLQCNPLRILDSKNPAMQELINAAPKLVDHLEVESRQRFDKLCTSLESVGVRYTLNPRLVRGLDYYCHTVFEWVTDELGAQGTVLAGGRYDSLVELLGGKPTPAVGFACGLERLALLLESTKAREQAVDLYVVVTEELVNVGLRLAETLRAQVSTLKVAVNLCGGSFKSQFKRADKSGAHYALVLGDDEVSAGQITVKDLRGEKPQQQLTEDALIHYLVQEK